MPIRKFPSFEHATSDGLLAMGGDLHPESLRLAYSEGIFPWPIEGLPLTWFAPPRRAILEFARLHVPRSLAKAARRNAFTFTIDEAFEDVITACADVERNDPDGNNSGTWITDPMIAAYVEFHRAGHAHSCEAWNAAGELVGGVYGVEVDGVYAGESMFHHESYASKLALLHLVEHLRARGCEWIDIQQLTPHMAALGARELERDEFMRLLRATQARNLMLFD